MWVFAAVLLVLGTTSGCSGCGAERSAGSVESTSPAGEEGSSGAERRPSSEGVSSSPPEVRIETETGLHGEVAAVIQSHADARLSSRILVEREAEGGKFVAVSEVRVFPLTLACGSPESDCLSLARGAELVTPAKLGASECGCQGCGAVPEGRYRFVVEACGGGPRVPGEPFTFTRR